MSYYFNMYRVYKLFPWDIDNSKKTILHMNMLSSFAVIEQMISDSNTNEKKKQPEKKEEKEDRKPAKINLGRNNSQLLDKIKMAAKA